MCQKLMKLDLLMHKLFLTPITILLLSLAIPTIAFEENNKKLNIKYELNANLDELILKYCNTYDSYTVSKLYSEKDILRNDKVRLRQLDKNFVVLRKKPLNPKLLTDIKTLNFNTELTIFSEIDIEYLSNAKKDFVRTVLPLIIKENQKILSLRNNLTLLSEKIYEKKSLNNNELKTIERLSKIYKINFNENYKLEVIQDLLDKVDIIPNSIVMAQAAIESGWGSSRFAKEYNALFGEYTYDNNRGVIPLKRENGEKHLIKSFNSYNSSVQSYFININSHYAYNSFRDIRKIMRERNNFQNVNLLVEKLNTYAEDENYINTIKSVIEKNKFNRFNSKTLFY